MVMSTLITQQLLERLASLLRSESRSLLFEFGLQPIQFEALHYLSMCNRYSDTPMAVTDYLGQTKGSVSQTLKVLEKKELLEKSVDSRDKRVTHLQLTQKGWALIEVILPSPVLQAAGKYLQDDTVETMNTSLSHLLNSLQKANQSRSFGQCSSCRHHINNAPGKYVCGLTEEVLSAKEATLICREHEMAEFLR